MMILKSKLLILLFVSLISLGCTTTPSEPPIRNKPVSLLTAPPLLEEVTKAENPALVIIKNNEKAGIIRSMLIDIQLWVEAAYN